MRSTITALALAVASSLATAQTQDQTGPFLLHIKGCNSDLDGYVSACHTGAALEGLCYTAGGKPAANRTASFQYYFNTTGSPQLENGSPAGTLFWRLPVQTDTAPFVEQPLSFQYQLNSNVAAPGFGFDSGSLVGFDDSALFAYSFVDDSTFKPNVRPVPGSYGSKHWYVCWQYLNGYYYQSVGLATTLPPSNPTCKPVEITQELA